jgi:hypothetical protein
MFDARVPHHWGYYWKSHYLPPLTEDAIEVLLERSWAKSSPESCTLLQHGISGGNRFNPSEVRSG